MTPVARINKNIFGNLTSIGPDNPGLSIDRKPISNPFILPIDPVVDDLSSSEAIAGAVGSATNSLDGDGNGNTAGSNNGGNGVGNGNGSGSGSNNGNNNQFANDNEILSNNQAIDVDPSINLAWNLC
ncbi:hypothetical protein ACMFMG_002465 [Clarireedia jacksonii]